MTAYSILIRSREIRCREAFGSALPFLSAAHKPGTVITTSLARLKFIPIGLLFRLTVRKVFQDSVRILLMM